jgi:hypothetical protein
MVNSILFLIKKQFFCTKQKYVLENHTISNNKIQVHQINKLKNLSSADLFDEARLTSMNSVIKRAHPNAVGLGFVRFWYAWMSQFESLSSEKSIHQVL